MNRVIIECDAWTVILLSKKSYILTNDYNFWPNDKRSILVVRHMMKECIIIK